MGWGSGINAAGREVGYLVDAECDEPGCTVRIDRGLYFVCGGIHDGGEHGCGGYFCDEHLLYDLERPELPQLCPTCIDRSGTGSAP